jgi:protein O-mannosyl-transferase
VKAIWQKYRLHFLACWMLCIVATLIYSNTFQSSFQFDDHGAIIENMAIRDISNIKFIWIEFSRRFIVGLTFALNYWFGGLNVVGYHVGNLLIHIFNGFLLYLFIQLIFQAPGLKHNSETTKCRAISFWGALLFLTHPIQTQGITYIYQRAVSLAALFYLLTLVLFLWYRLQDRWICYVMAIITTLLAMLSKEMALTIPFMLLGIELFFFDSSNKSLRIRLIRLFPFLIATFIIPLNLFVIDKTTATQALRNQILQANLDYRNFLTEINVLRTYLRLLIFPVNQNLDYDYPQAHGWGDGEVLLSLGVLAALAFWGVRYYHRNRIISFCIFWFFLTTSVETVFCAVLGQDYLFEHFLYLPMAGFALALSWIAMRCFNQKWGVMLLCVLSTIWGMLSYQRNEVWKDPVSLWQDTVRKSPRKARPYDNLAAALIARGDYSQARIVLGKALALDSRNPETYNNLGLVFLQSGDLRKAQEYFETSIRLKPGFGKAYSNLGLIYLRQGERKTAEEYFLKAAEYNPHLTEPWLNLASIYQQQGEFEKARNIFGQLLTRDPYDENCLFHLISIDFKMGQKTSAITAGKELLKRGKKAPRLTDAGVVFAKQNFTNMATALFLKSLELDPAYELTYLEYGKLLGNQENFVQAIAIWQKGLERNPQSWDFISMIAEARRLIREKEGRESP